MEGAHLPVQYLVLQLPPVLLAAVVHQNVQGGAPQLQLPHPVLQSGGGHHDEVRPILLLLLEVCEERDGLDRLAQTHLVRQDPVHLLLVHHRQPVEANQLVGGQLEAVVECGRLLLDVALGILAPRDQLGDYLLHTVGDALALRHEAADHTPHVQHILGTIQQGGRHSLDRLHLEHERLPGLVGTVLHDHLRLLLGAAGNGTQFVKCGRVEEVGDRATGLRLGGRLVLSATGVAVVGRAVDVLVAVVLVVALVVCLGPLALLAAAAPLLLGAGLP
uniref:Secreted protein n=1 Tax=Ixodes ricinus TaxID=34613 RepID=A0A6B0V698_IXORI